MQLSLLTLTDRHGGPNVVLQIHVMDSLVVGHGSPDFPNNPLGQQVYERLPKSSPTLTHSCRERPL
jgi:hypothetical protein